MREMSLHILDLARNSIEAGATAIELSIIEDADSDSFSFTLVDNGYGMDEAELERATDAFFTTRTTRRQGLGLALLKATCERCGGALHLTSQLGEGTVVCGTMQCAHLDRPPLGNMGAVIQALVCESDRVSLRYHHMVNRRRFVLDTAQIMCPIGPGQVTDPTELERPRLTDPAVLCWIANMVNKELRSLREAGECKAEEGFAAAGETPALPIGAGEMPTAPVVSGRKVAASQP